MGSTPEELTEAYERCRHEPRQPCTWQVLEREQPVHEVTVSPFYLDQTEVTNEQFMAWLNRQRWLDVRRAQSSSTQQTQDRYVYDHDVRILDLHPTWSGLVYQGNNKFAIRDGFARRPVVQVTWDGAQRYCEAQGKRLPTEAEWEFAARGPERRRYPWGDTAPQCETVAVARDGVACPQLPTGPAEVGTSSQDRTPQWVMDMGGNVMEWVQDQLRVPYPACPSGCRNPIEDSPASQRLEDERVIRGGSWFEPTFSPRAAGRGTYRRTERANNLGFRCAAPGD